MSSEQYMHGNEVYTSGLSDLTATELVKYTESILLFLADGGQVQRDMIAGALRTEAEERCEQALREGNLTMFIGHSRTKRLINRVIEKHGYGRDFISANDLTSARWPEQTEEEQF